MKWAGVPSQFYAEKPVITIRTSQGQSDFPANCTAAPGQCSAWVWPLKTLSIFGALKVCAKCVDNSSMASVTQAHHQRKAESSLAPSLIPTHQYTLRWPARPGPGPLCPTELTGGQSKDSQDFSPRWDGSTGPSSSERPVSTVITRDATEVLLVIGCSSAEEKTKEGRGDLLLF